jgi:hypothetical protein
VGRLKHLRIMPGGALETESSAAAAASIFVGRKLNEHRGAFYLEYPMDKGAVTENGWEAMERLWEVSLMEPSCISIQINFRGLIVFVSDVATPARVFETVLERQTGRTSCPNDRGSTERSKKSRSNCRDFL